jgi:hypothetical protein
MAKRPYSTQYTARSGPRRYLLSGIPPTLWERARAKARAEGRAMRQVILQLVEQWVDAKEPPTLDEQLRAAKAVREAAARMLGEADKLDPR